MSQKRPALPHQHVEAAVVETQSEFGLGRDRLAAALLQSAVVVIAAPGEHEDVAKDDRPVLDELAPLDASRAEVGPRVIEGQRCTADDSQLSGLALDEAILVDQRRFAADRLSRRAQQDPLPWQLQLIDLAHDHRHAAAPLAGDRRDPGVGVALVGALRGVSKGGAAAPAA